MDRELTSQPVLPALGAARSRRYRSKALPEQGKYLPSRQYWLLRLIMGTYGALMVRRIRWVDGVRLDKGPHILVSNHGNVTDGFLLIAHHPGRLHALIQAESFSLPIMGSVFRHSGQIPVAEGQGLTAIDMARTFLAQGDSVLIYPEGKLNHGQGMLRGKVGAARLAFETGEPILPVGAYVEPRWSKAIRGHFYDRPTFGHWQMGGTCYFAVGEAWQPFAPEKDKVDLHELRLVTDEMMRRIQSLVERARAAAG
ncbi:MAG TPA: lysophospholipid acyltransferase family protein [Anaerolineales bacterium]|nr:lysophospholipid acyltransferase family protein [Anaerolineales bacterium]